MSKLLFKLNNVPDDEADEVRALLEQAEIDFYETSSGNWGLSFAAIWLKNDQEFNQAKQLLDEYQTQRYLIKRQQQQELKDSGQVLSRWQLIKSSPIKIPIAVIFVSLLIYFSILPFYPA